MKRYFVVAAVFMFALSSCSVVGTDRKQTGKEIRRRKAYASFSGYISAVNSKKEAAVKNYVESLSSADKVCQLFIVNLEGDTVFVPVEKKSELGAFYVGADGNSGTDYIIPGGYLFFSYNLAESPEKIMNFTDSVRRACTVTGALPPFLAVDQEGGFVNRLKTVNGPLPSCERVAQKLDVKHAYELYSMQAGQMRALGFDMNIAPVVEICTPMNEDFLDGRSFGSAEKVVLYSAACVNAYENNGVGAVAKHFPGNTNTDPHTGLPEIQLSAEELENQLVSFRAVAGIHPSGILMSHARTSCIDSDVPACLSEKWVSEKLRKEYGFDGIVFSDDIFMGALAANGYPPEKAAVMAVEAGIDCIMISEKRIARPAKVLLERMAADGKFAEKIDKSVTKLVEYKIKRGLLEFEDDGTGGLVLVNAAPSETVHDRIVRFNDLREKNIELYIEYFR